MKKIHLSQKLMQFGRIFEDAGHHCYLVGGAVRNILANRPHSDFDFTTETNQSQLANENRIEALKELGQVLSDYPILMDYLKIYAESDKDMNLIKLPQ